MKFIDLSTPIVHQAPCDPPVQRPTIEYQDHDSSVEGMLDFFPGATKEDLPDGKGWAVETVTLGTHTGTHLDAPYHYHPTMDGGSPAWTIDQVPLDWCFHDGVMLDFSDYPNAALLTPADLQRKLDAIGYRLKPYDIVLIQSGAAPWFETEEYLSHGVGVGWDATCWLTEQGVKITGTDAWSWDRPLSVIAEEFARTRDRSIIWEGHKAGMVRAYCHMEKLGNLDKLPPTGFRVACFPVNIRGASAGWTRPVAIMKDDRPENEP